MLHTKLSRQNVRVRWQVNITKLELTHFGKFHMKTITFTSGLNVVYGKNEAGKSTIHAFVRSMLFGIPETEEGNARYEHYRPWDTPDEYSGKMWISKEGKTYRIERSFLRTAISCTVFNETDNVLLEPAKHKLRELLDGLTETNYMNTICIEQMKNSAEPHLAKELQELAVNASLSKNMHIDVEKAKQELSLKKQSLEAQLITDAQKVHQENIKLASESQSRLSRLQRSRYIREKQSAELLQQISKEQKQAEEDYMSYERQRDELRRRYEADKKASENAMVDEDSSKKSISWIIWIIIGIVAWIFTIYRYKVFGMENRESFWILTGGICAVFICIMIAFFSVWRGKEKRKNMTAARKLSEELGIKFEESLNAFEECKTKAPESADKRCKPLKEQYAKAQRELSYLIHQQREEENTLEVIAQKEQKLKGAASENERLSAEIEAVDMAIKTITHVSARIRATFGNLLNSEASRILSDITKGRYEKLVIGQDMKVRVFSAGKSVELESISRGTIEQVYLSVRVAAAKLLWKDEPMPFLFDDVFAYYDDERLEAAMDMLKKCGHQIIIFSCHSREDSLLG